MRQCFGCIPTQLLALHKAGASKELRVYISSYIIHEPGNNSSLGFQMPAFGKPPVI